MAAAPRATAAPSRAPAGRTRRAPDAPLTRRRMSRILIAGLPARLAGWLAQRLANVLVEVAFTGDDAVAMLREGGWGLLVIDRGVEGLPAAEAVRLLRASAVTGSLPVIVTADPAAGADPAELHRLVDELGVHRILLHPLDRGELARLAGSLLRTPPPVARPQPRPEPPAEAPAAGKAAEVGEALSRVWERSREGMLARVNAVERVVVDTMEGRLTEEGRRAAEAEAHRLSGALGTFGSAEGSRLAKQIEATLSGPGLLTRLDGARLAKLTAALRQTVEGMGGGASAERAAAPAAPARGEVAPPAPPVSSDPRPLVLLVDRDVAMGRALEGVAAARGIRLRAALDAGRARDALSVERPAAVLVDLSGDDEAGAWEFLPELAKRLPGVPVLVFASQGSLLDRVRLLQVGTRVVLTKPIPPEDVLDAVARVLPRPGQSPARILAVDDDPAMLAAVKAVLEPQRLSVHTLEDPLRFWTTLEEVRPDLLVLDVDMPHLSGIELCRVVRADHRWSRLPVVFLTARTDRDTVLRVFAAGADDYVTKPVIGPELTARIRDRLERLPARE